MFSARFCIVHPVLLQIIPISLSALKQCKIHVCVFKIQKMLQIEVELCPPANECCDSRINSLLKAVGKPHKVSLFQHPPAAAATFTRWGALFWVDSEDLHHSSICPTCVGLISIAAEWLANHICYLMILSADTFIYLSGSLFYLCSQLLPAPFWSHSTWVLHSCVSLAMAWILILVSLPLCVHCTCWGFTLPELAASSFQ